MLAFAKYLVSGAGSYIVSFALLAVLVDFFKMEHRLAFGISITISFLLNFIGLKFFVFKDTSGGVKKKFVTAIGINLTFRYFEYICSLALASSIHYLAASVLVTVAFFIIKFVLYRMLFSPTGTNP